MRFCVAPFLGALDAYLRMCVTRKPETLKATGVGGLQASAWGGTMRMAEALASAARGKDAVQVCSHQGIPAQRLLKQMLNPKPYT